jgi:hypothetical protein
MTGADAEWLILLLGVGSKASSKAAIVQNAGRLQRALNMDGENYE